MPLRDSRVFADFLSKEKPPVTVQTTLSGDTIRGSAAAIASDNMSATSDARISERDRDMFIPPMLFAVLLANRKGRILAPWCPKSQPRVTFGIDLLGSQMLMLPIRFLGDTADFTAPILLKILQGRTDST